MEDRNESFTAFCGLTEETADRLHEVASTLADRMGVSVEEAAECISRAIQWVEEGLKAVIDRITQTFEELMESVETDIQNEPRARRRKAERDRARSAEHTYRTKIKRFERARPFRRIYKPP